MFGSLIRSAGARLMPVAFGGRWRPGALSSAEQRSSPYEWGPRSAQRPPERCLILRDREASGSNPRAPDTRAPRPIN